MSSLSNTKVFNVSDCDISSVQTWNVNALSMLCEMFISSKSKYECQTDTLLRHTQVLASSDSFIKRCV
jgi:hypothetical protein